MPQEKSLMNVTAVSLWLASKNTALSAAREIVTVDTDHDLQIAAQAQTEINRLIKDLEKERLSLTRHLDAEKKRIMKEEEDMVADLQAEKDRLKKLNSAYATAKAAQAAEAARVERERQEAEYRKQQEEYKRQQAEAAATADILRDVFDVEAGEEEAAPPPAQPEPVREEKVSVSGARVSKRWKFNIVNPGAIPREYLIVDEKLIREHIRDTTRKGISPNIPGVEFTTEMHVEG